MADEQQALALLADAFGATVVSGASAPAGQLAAPATVPWELVAPVVDDQADDEPAPRLVAPAVCLDPWACRCGLTADEHYEAYGAPAILSGQPEDIGWKPGILRPPTLVAPYVMNDEGELCCAGFVAPDGTPEYCLGCTGPLNLPDRYRQSDVAAGVAIERAERRAPQLVAPAVPPGPEGLAVELTEAVKRYALADPRNQQLVAGPSDLGHPCAGFLTRKLLGFEPGPNRDADPWASLVGKWVHAGLAEVFEQENARLGHPLYLIERRVRPSDGIGGSCDLYRGGLVVDHKIVGAESMRSLKSSGFRHKGGQYDVQLDLYGLGYEREGFEVTEVALAAWPRSGFLAGLHILRRPYNRSNAEAALDRASNLSAGALEEQADEYDGPWEAISTNPGSHCAFCPWRSESADETTRTRSECGAWRQHEVAKRTRRSP